MIDWVVSVALIARDAFVELLQLNKLHFLVPFRKHDGFMLPFLARDTIAVSQEFYFLVKIKLKEKSCYI